MTILAKQTKLQNDLFNSSNMIHFTHSLYSIFYIYFSLQGVKGCTTLV